MKPRDILLEKMCEIYTKDKDLYSHEYCMEKALQLAEKFLQTASFNTNQEEPVSYAHRILTTMTAEQSDSGIGVIRAWLTHDASLEVRKAITAQDCEKLAIRIASLTK